MVENMFQIRSLRAPNPLIQMVVLRDVNLLLQINNCIVAAQGNSLHGLMPVPIGAQVYKGKRIRDDIF